MVVRRSLGRLAAAAVCACLLLAAAAAQQPCLTPAHFAVNGFMECQLECASRGAAKGMGFSGTYKTYQSATGYMCCECGVAQTASMLKAVVLLEGVSVPMPLEEQHAVQDVLLHIILEFWTWRGSQPLTEDMLDRLLQAPGPQRRRRALLQGPADAAGDQWWPDAVAVPQTARMVGILAYVDTAVNASQRAEAIAELQAESAGGNLTSRVQGEGVPSASSARILYVGTDNPDLSLSLDGGSGQEGGAAGSGADPPAQEAAAPAAGAADAEAPAVAAPGGVAGPDAVAPPDQGPSGSSSLVIAVAVTLGVLAAVAVGTFVFCRWRRRAQYQKWQAPSAPPAYAASHQSFQAFRHEKWQSGQVQGAASTELR